jgi:hypothetical protein
MGKKQIVVPEGMLKAAIDAVGEMLVKGRQLSDGTSGILLELPGREQTALEAALRWLGENPIVPTNKQIDEFVMPLAKRPGGVSEMEICAEWQRRIFLALEPETPRLYTWEEAQRLINDQRKRTEAELQTYKKCGTPDPEMFDSSLGGRLSGRTFTQKQADAIKEYVQRSVHPSYREKKQEVPEEIKDLMETVGNEFTLDEDKWGDPAHVNKRILEAYRRGMGNCRQAQKEEIK